MPPSFSLAKLCEYLKTMAQCEEINHRRRGRRTSGPERRFRFLQTERLVRSTAIGTVRLGTNQDKAPPTEASGRNRAQEDARKESERGTRQ